MVFSWLVRVAASRSYASNRPMDRKRPPASLPPLPSFRSVCDSVEQLHLSISRIRNNTTFANREPRTATPEIYKPKIRYLNRAGRGEAADPRRRPREARHRRGEP